MLGDKRIFMELGDEEDFESNKSQKQKQKKEVRDEIEDTAIDKALDKLIDGVEVLKIGGGMATIAMPLELLKILKMFSKLLDITQEKGIMR